MKFKLEIDCDNDAFNVWPGIEVARILRNLAGRVDGDTEGMSGSVRDINGNTIGKWEFSRQ